MATVPFWAWHLLFTSLDFRNQYRNIFSRYLPWTKFSASPIPIDLLSICVTVLYQPNVTWVVIKIVYKIVKMSLTKLILPKRSLVLLSQVCRRSVADFVNYVYGTVIALLLLVVFVEECLADLDMRNYRIGFGMVFYVPQSNENSTDFGLFLRTALSETEE